MTELINATLAQVVPSHAEACSGFRPLICPTRQGQFVTTITILSISNPRSTTGTSGAVHAGTFASASTGSRSTWPRPQTVSM